MKRSLIYYLPVLLTACGDRPTSVDLTYLEDVRKEHPDLTYPEDVREEQPEEESTPPLYFPIDVPIKKECLSVPREKSLQPYYDLLINNDKITEAIRLCDYSAALQQQMWTKIAEAEKNGIPPTAPLPSSFYSVEFNQESISVTKDEAYEIYAAHLAHSLWLEKNKIVPWSIIEYTQAQLEQLLHPKAWFKKWDEAKEEYSFNMILGNSPREAFTVAEEAASPFSDQWTAMDDIIRSVRPFRHSIVQLDLDGNVIGGDPQEIVTIPTMDEELMSRHGCQTMSQYVVQIANSLNIPGRYINGYYYAAGHRSALFDFTDDLLAHGDDVYHYNYLGNTPSSEIMDSYDFWEENVLTFEKKDKTAAHNSMLYTYRKAMQYPAQRLLTDYCDEGRSFLEDTFLYHQFGSLATVEELDALEQKIVEITKDCTIFPENNPDK
ncbi:MAG: hypothetical protein AABY40_02285 [Nanoarchaeota archaeon]